MKCISHVEEHWSIKARKSKEIIIDWKGEGCVCVWGGVRFCFQSKRSRPVSTIININAQKKNKMKKEEEEERGGGEEEEQEQEQQQQQQEGAGRGQQQQQKADDEIEK